MYDVSTKRRCVISTALIGIIVENHCGIDGTVNAYLSPSRVVKPGAYIGPDANLNSLPNEVFHSDAFYKYRYPKLPAIFTRKLLTRIIVDFFFNSGASENFANHVNLHHKGFKSFACLFKNLLLVFFDADLILKPRKRRIYTGNMLRIWQLRDKRWASSPNHLRRESIGELRVKVAEDDIASKLAILKKSLHLNDNTCFCTIIQASKLVLGSLLAKNPFLSNFEQKMLHPPGWPIVGVAYRRSGPSAAKMQLKRRIRHCPVACG